MVLFIYYKYHAWETGKACNLKVKFEFEVSMDNSLIYNACKSCRFTGKSHVGPFFSYFRRTIPCFIQHRGHVLDRVWWLYTRCIPQKGLPSTTYKVCHWGTRDHPMSRKLVKLTKRTRELVKSTQRTSQISQEN